jgi:signal transduction histidine kinase
VTITALHDRQTGGLVGFAKVTRDLTERTQNEAAVRTLSVENAALTEKTRGQEFQERFVAILGHDLRNPLSAIDMGVALLKQRADENHDETATRILGRMQGSSRRMTRMIEQILDLTRTRLAGGIKVVPVSMDLAKTIAAIAEELRTAQPGRIIDVRSPPSLVGNWDKDRLEQVFSNLISNAVHHGDRARPVEVTLREDGESVEVSVHNHGRAIPEELRTELFNAFRRGARDGRTADTEGLGLGLYISHEIVAAHHGKLDVTSGAEEGTTFRVTLPRG